MGIYILFAIISPIIKKVSGNSMNLKSLSVANQQTTTRYNKIELDTNVYIEENYKNSITEQIKLEVENLGYKVNNIDLEIETKNQGKYGNINSVEIYITKENIEAKIVNQIKINNIETIEKNNTVKKNIIQEEDCNKITEFLYNNYKIEQILIKMS